MDVMIATDGSAGARTAVDVVTDWPVRRENLFVVAAVSPTQPALSSDEGRKQPSTFGAEFPILASEIADGEVERLSDAGHYARSVVLTGDPADALQRYAHEKQIDLIILGAQGTGAIGHFQLGSVTQRVAHHAPCSVLAIRPPAGTINSIVLATDGSELAYEAVDVLAALPVHQETAAHVLFVLPQPETQIIVREPQQRERLKAVATELRTEFESVARSVCDEVVHHLSLSGLTSDSEIAIGKPAAEIIAFADRADADLIVVGAQSRPDLATSLLGSVALAVLKGAPCSVLIGRIPAQS